MRLHPSLLALLLAAHACAPRATGMLPIAADAHVHVLSPAGAHKMTEVLGPDGALVCVALGRRQVLAMLDSAGVDRAIIISSGYAFGSPDLRVADERAHVEQENDWAVAEANGSSGRLQPFCSMNPLREYALDELQRCARMNVGGVKLNFPGAGINLRDEKQVRTLQLFFALANALRLDIIAHIRTEGPDYSAAEVAVFIDRVARFAPDVNLQVAHLGGWGGFDAVTEATVDHFATALSSGRLSRERTYFDLAAVLIDAPDTAVARVIERLGAENVLFATDWPLINAAECREKLMEATKHRPGMFERLAKNRPNHRPRR